MEPPLDAELVDAAAAHTSPPCDATTASDSEQQSSKQHGVYRSRCKRDFVQEAAPPPEPLREACQLDYDLARYPFAELVAEALGLSDTAALATLHETSDGRKAQAHPPRAGQCAFRRRWRTWLDKEPGARARLNAMFRAFVENEVVRHFGEPAVYQARPAARACTVHALGVHWACTVHACTARASSPRLTPPLPSAPDPRPLTPDSHP